MLLALSQVLSAQQSALSLSSAVGVNGGTVGLSLSVANSGGAQPGGLEWTMTYPAADFSAVTAVAGAAAVGANTTLTCSAGAGSAKCTLDGMQDAVIGNGVVANLTFTVASNASAGSVAIGIANPVAVGPNGSQIPASSIGGAVTVQAVSGLSCNAPVASPGSSTCTVTLSSAAPAGGTIVILSSNNASVTVPASVTIAAGQTTGTFAATVLSVSSGLTATLTATLGSSSKTFGLQVTASAWAISGTISPAVSGVSMALTGAATQTATTNASGAYTFSGLANGSYTVTPSLSGYAFTPGSQAVTVNGANQLTVNFTDVNTQPPAYVPPTVDVDISKDQKTASTTVTSSTFSTASGDELLLAFVSSDSRNATVKSISCAGLTWVLVERTNVQDGTAEIWRAFAPQQLANVEATVTLAAKAISSLTITSFTGVDTSGTNGSGAMGAVSTANGASGAPSASLTTTRNESLIQGVGNDTKGGAAPVALSGQSLIHQYSASNPGNFWVQRVTNPVTQSGTAIAFGDSSPTSGSYNLSVVEILAAPPAGGTTTNALRAQPESVPSAGSVTGSPVTLYHPATGATGDVCSPGGLVSVRGAGFTSQTPQAAKAGLAPERLAGVEVKVNGRTAPLLFASASRVNFLCPKLPAGSSLDVSVEGENGAIQRPAQSSMAAAAPGIFTVDESNQGVVQIAATNEIAMSQREGIRSRPARQGETLHIYATGLGSVTDDTKGANPPLTVDPQTYTGYPVRVAVGDTFIDPAFVRPTPESAGVFAIGLSLPESGPTGLAVPVHIEVTLPDKTTVVSNVVTMAIQ